MANPKGNVKNLKPFKKGQPSGNPEGARAHNPEVKMFKKLTEAELIEVGTLVIKGKVSELKARMKHPDTTVIQAMTIGVALRTMSKGDPAAFNALLDRLLGKAREHIHLSGVLDTVSKIKVSVTIPSNGSEAPSTKLDAVDVTPPILPEIKN